MPNGIEIDEEHFLKQDEDTRQLMMFRSLESVRQRVNELPCVAETERLKAVRTQVRLLWAFALFVLGKILFWR